jgi:pathogenesis-related protein 1
VAPLVWDERLAATAEAWVRRCVDEDATRGVVDHNPDRSAGQGGYVGENLAAGTAPVSAETAVDGWASEGDYYDYRRNRCARGRNCGHYTQVVWADTVRIGCAAHFCRRLDFPYTVVCDYGPGGNSGGRPY